MGSPFNRISKIRLVYVKDVLDKLSIWDNVFQRVRAPAGRSSALACQGPPANTGGVPPLLNTMHALHDLEKINCIGDKSVDVLTRILDISNALFIGCRPTHNKSASFDPAT
jgi:hypothetical protein